MTVKLKNNAFGYLATAVSASDVGVVVGVGEGAAFPALSAGEYFYATLVGTNNAYEIVKVTARVGDTMAVTRAQESTVAQSFAAGSRLEARVTAQSVLDAVSDGVTALGFASAISYTPAGTGAVVTNVQAKLRERVSVFDFLTAAQVADVIADTALVDVTAGIRAAVAALTDNSELVFPPGTYRISRSGNDVLMMLSGLDNVNITGYGARIVCAHDLATGTFNLIKFDTCTKITISGFDIDYTITNVTGCTGERAEIATIDPPASPTALCKFLKFFQCRFRLENVSDPSTWAVESSGGVSGPLAEGDDPYTPAYKLMGIFFNGDYLGIYRHSNITVDQCEFNRMTARTFWMWACEDISFTNNIIDNRGARRPQVRIIVGNRNIKVLGNTFYNNNPYSRETSITFLRQAVNEDQAHQAVVANNTFYYGKGTGVNVGGFKNVTIANNTFKINPAYDPLNLTNTSDSNGYAGVSVGSANSGANDRIENIVVTGNVFDGVGRYTTFYYGYSSFTAPTRNIVIANNTVANTLGLATTSGAVSLGYNGQIESVVVSNNSFYNCVAGIDAYFCKDVHITGNKFSGTTRATGFGIYMADGDKINFQVSNNNFSLMQYGLYATAITWPDEYWLYMTGGSGSFTGTVTGGTSGATGTIATSGATTRWGATSYVTLTGASGRFREGETVTASGGGTAIVVAYYAGADEVYVTNNVFQSIGTVVFRNYVTVPHASGNYFRDVASIANLLGPTILNNYNV